MAEIEVVGDAKDMFVVVDGVKSGAVIPARRRPGLGFRLSPDGKSLTVRGCALPSVRGASETSEPAIHNHDQGVWIPGLRQVAHPSDVQLHIGE
jgi:hypothetical protein